MKKIIALSLLLSGLSLQLFAQLMTRPGTPTATSFYSKTQFVKDGQAAKNIRHSNNKIVEQLDNPHGTVVMDADGSLEDLKTLASNAESVRLKDHIEIVSYNNSKGIKYEISVNNMSGHHNLSNKLLIDELQLFSREFKVKTGEVPYQITIRHSNRYNQCELLGFRSIENLYLTPIYLRRLNIGCAYLFKIRREYLASL